MCGIAGALALGGAAPPSEADVAPMTDALTHRGPDDRGLWRDASAGVALGHRRLAIIDASPTGAQPMRSPCGRWTLVYNGEIYDFRALRAELVGYDWRGTSDTEVLLAWIARIGLEATLERCRGMFALALWDAERRALALARDRMGEKPLYVGAIPTAGGETLIFGSELKALRAHPAWSGAIDRQAIAACVRHGHIPAPRSLYANVAKVPAGTIWRFDRAAASLGDRAERRYFDLLECARRAKVNRFSGTLDEAAEALRALIDAAVARQMVADVPLGAFLSGGVDSSTVVASMQRQSSRKVQSFALGFREAAFDESAHARAMAARLGTDHHEIVLTGEDARERIAAMPEIYDEPFCDESQLPTTLLAEFARRTVTVALSGDGGDELFVGYRRYASFLRKRKSGSSFLRRGYLAAASAFAGPARRLRLDDRRRKLDASGPVGAYERGFTHVDLAHRFVLGAEPVDDPLAAEIDAIEGWSASDGITVLDMARYLPDAILTKVDRAAMAAGLETRAPLLDPDVVEFALSLPDELADVERGGKAALKRVLEADAPRALWDRPKQGFGVPLEAWLRGPLGELVGDLLGEAGLARTGVFDPAWTAPIVEEFRRGGSRRPNLIWTLLAIQLYLDRAASSNRASH